MPHDSAQPAAGSATALPRASGIVVYLSLLIAATLVFGLWPQLDLAISSFARDLNGGAFQLKGGPWNWLYRGTRPFFLGLSAVVAAAGIASLLLRRPLGWMTPRKAIFILVSFGLTQGIVVDLYLKSVFGRPRPRELTDFGGDSTFTPFYLVSDQCSSNCAFVSGHAAMVFALLAFSFVLPERWRRPAFWLALAAGLVSGWARIQQGAHFASDVIFAGLVTYGVTWLVSLLILRGWIDRYWQASLRRRGAGREAA
ncbi:MAG TPA: phosphatase PAP2 family protein [Kiloniellales bacterium]|nr:phosphatase PAP2 family protein [Kiloniellales bacterium]